MWWHKLLELWKLWKTWRENRREEIHFRRHRNHWNADFTKRLQEKHKSFQEHRSAWKRNWNYFQR